MSLEFATCISSKVPMWLEEMRTAGFDASFSAIDWATNEASIEEKRLQLDYDRAYRQAILLEQDASKIIYDDSLLEDQPFLNALKAQRSMLHGPISNVFANPKTRHLAQLTPLLQRLSRVFERMSARDVDVSNDIERIEKARKADSVRRYRSAIGEILDQSGDSASAKLGSILERLWPPLECGPRFFGTKLRGNTLAAGSYRVNGQVMICVLAELELRNGYSPKSSPNGEIYVYFCERPTACDLTKFGSHDRFYNLLEFVPGGVYQKFSNEVEMVLSVLFWRRLLEVVLPAWITCRRLHAK